MKKLITLIACLALCVCLIGTNVVMAADPTPDFIAAENGIEVEAGVSDDQTTYENFDLTLGSEWTVSGEFASMGYENAFYRQILVKGPKDAGHFEVYLQPDGKIAMYLPDGNGGGTANTAALDDGEAHAFCFVGKDNAITFYVDGAVAEGSLGAYAAFTEETETFKLGDLVEGGMPYTGSIKGIRIFATKAVDDELAKRLSTVGYKPAADEPKTEEPSDAAPAVGTAIVWNATENGPSQVGPWLNDDGGRTYSAVFNVNKPFNEIVLHVFFGSNPPTFGNGLYNMEVSLYKFDYNYENSIAGTPVATAKIINCVGDNNSFQNDTPSFSVAGTNLTLQGANNGLQAVLGSDLPAGQYVLVFTNDGEAGGYMVLPNVLEMTSDVDFYRGTTSVDAAFRFGVNTNGQFVDLIPDQEVPTEAPQTGDMTVAVFAVIAVVALAAIVVLKKRVNA